MSTDSLMRHATSLTEPVPWRVRDVAGRLWRHSREDGLTSAAASAAFYLVLASVPALAAVVSVYTLISNPSDIKALAENISPLLPSQAAHMLQQEINQAIDAERGSGGSLTGSVIWFAMLLWSANRGVRGLVNALNVIYDRAEERGLLLRLGLTLLLTAGAVVFAVLSITGVVLLPVVFAALGLGTQVTSAADIARWPVLFALAAVAIALLYRFGPSRQEVEWRWILVGAGTAAVLWVALSVVFAWSIQTFGGFSRLYGSLGAVAGFMLWMWLSALAVLIGAEIDAAVSVANNDWPQRGEDAPRS